MKIETSQHHQQTTTNENAGDTATQHSIGFHHQNSANPQPIQNTKLQLPTPMQRQDRYQQRLRLWFAKMGNGVQWIAFEYSRDRVKMEYTIRLWTSKSVKTDNLSQEIQD